MPRGSKQVTAITVGKKEKHSDCTAIHRVRRKEITNKVHSMLHKPVKGAKKRSMLHKYQQTSVQQSVDQQKKNKNKRVRCYTSLLQKYQQTSISATT